MKQHGRRNKTTFHQLFLRGLLATAAVPGVLSTVVLCRQLQSPLQQLKTDTAVFSALYTVPEQARQQLDSLDDRFSPKVEDFEEGDLPEAKPVLPQNPPEPEQETVPEETSPEVPEELPEIPEEYRGDIVEEDLSVDPKNHKLTFGHPSRPKLLQPC